MSYAVGILAATILDHPWLLLIAVAIGLIRWLAQKAQSDKDISQPPKPPAQPIPRSNTQTEEERVRRFLEALGQPPGTRPPPAVARRSTAREAVQHVPPPIRSPLPPLKTVPPPLPTAMEPPPIPQRVEPRLFKPAISSEPIFELRPAGGADDPLLARLRLATKQSLRDTIVLREIFGPPRSLQPPETVSGF
jgi:hypothetical protein